MNKPQKKTDTEQAVIIERTFDAPVDAVWKALTEKDQIAQWSFPVDDFKPQVGFSFKFTAGKDEVKYVHQCKVTEAVPNKKLAYTWRYEGYEGDSLVSIDLFAEGDKTKLRLTHTGLETFQPESFPHFARENFFKGWTMLIGTALKAHVEKSANPGGSPEFTISRTFDAPREHVWKAWTTPELMAKWWGPKGVTVGKYKMDFRVGGTYHYSMVTPDGSVMWGKFIYREIIAPEKLVFVNCFSDEKGGVTRHPFSPGWPLELLSTITFAEEKGKTTVTIHWLPLNANEQERKVFTDGMAGMQQGWGGTLDQLTAFLAEA